MRTFTIETVLVSILSACGGWGEGGPEAGERGGRREEAEREPPREDSRPLTTEQKARVREILAEYDASSVTADDARAMNEAFRAAGLRGGAELREAIEDAGFDPEEIGRLAPPPGRRDPVPGGSGRDPRDVAPPSDRRPRADERGEGYSIQQAISDQAQRNTIAFDALAFLTGTLGSQSFLPPGKVADYSGFQYLRDNDPTGLGHNTDFVTIVAFNMLHILTAEQVRLLVDRAGTRVDEIRRYAYARFPLMKAFRRLLDGDLPEGATELDKDAVMAASASLYRIDGEISYDRAELLGGIIRSLTPEQRAALDRLKGLGGVGNWDRGLTDPLKALQLSHDENVAVMTYASEMYAWYAGSVDADTYFCPERQGTYFGSFYLKDWPAMGNPGTTIDEQLTASAGEDFLAALTPSQAAVVTDLVDEQRGDLLAIVDTRRAISTELRRFMTADSIDGDSVMSLSERYGQLDGALVHAYATRFAQVHASLEPTQRDRLDTLVDALGYRDPPGAFLYSQPIDMPAVEDTDYLFGVPGGSTTFQLTSPDVAADGVLPADYTCDGTGATLPLVWTGAPEGTRSFALILHHVAPDAVKWYWILYDLPASVGSLSRNATGVGTLGTNSVDGRTGYEPPCSQGPGPKTYILTVYALSAPVELAIPSSGVTREVLLAAMSDRTLATASLEVTYTRSSGATSTFRRGDSNGDGTTDIGDATALLGFLFLGGTRVSCHQAGDANDDGSLDIADAVYILRYLFLTGEAIAPPFETCGPDPTGDDLPCDSYPGCP